MKTETRLFLWRATLFALAMVAIALATLVSASSVASLLPTDARETSAAVAALLRVLFLIDAALLVAAAVTRWSDQPGIAASTSGIRSDDEIAGDAAPRWALPAIVAGGLLLRLPGLDSQMWLDEIATVVTYLRTPWLQTLSLYESANQHLLYSLLGSISIHLFGEHPWSARLPALLFGVAGIWAIDRLGRLVMTRRESLVAASLLAVSYHDIWFSQNARGYTGMIFVACLGSELFLRAVTSNRARNWIAYAFVMAFGVGLLQNTAFVAMGHLLAYAVTLLVRRVPWTSHRSVSTRLVGALVLAAYVSVHLHALVLPRIVGFMGSAGEKGLAWTGLSAFVPVVSNGLRAGLGLVGVVAVLGFVAFAAASILRQSVLFAGIAAFPALVNLAALVLIGYRPYPRSFLYVLPFALLLAARGASLVDRALLARISTRLKAFPVAGVALVILSLSPLSRLYRLPKQDYLGALERARSEAKTGDCVAAIGLATTAYRDYYAPELEFPGDAGGLRRLEARCRRVVLLYTLPGDLERRFPRIVESIRSRYDPVASFPGTVGDGTVFVARSKTDVAQ